MDAHAMSEHLMRPENHLKRELLFGGPRRPFELTVQQACLLADALDSFTHAYRLQMEVEPEPVIDDNFLADAEALRLRLRQFQGFNR